MDKKKWLQLSLLNLLIVSFLGVILRYKIAFSLSLIDQKRLLHGHSHFAFSGWISQALMTIIVVRLSAFNDNVNFKRYNPLLWANLVCAYGMLLSFPVQGYGLFSIFFSTAALIVSYVFMAFVWHDMKTSQMQSTFFPWAKAATFFNSLSSLGAFALAYMMASKNMHQHWYLGSVYFFLHFQYNGWFSFTVLGLLCEKLAIYRVPAAKLRLIFILMVVSCIPAYFLSALWMPIPTVVYLSVVASALMQTIAWAILAGLVWRNRELLRQELTDLPYYVLQLSLLAFSIKFMLQLGSTIPSLSTLAFGFRPIVIGYLHLVLLGAVSLGVIAWIMQLKAITITPAVRTGIFVFITGIILNELLLMVQGFAAICYIAIPYVNEGLFCIALIMFTGLLLMNLRRNDLSVASENSAITGQHS